MSKHLVYVITSDKPQFRKGSNIARELDMLDCDDRAIYRRRVVILTTVSYWPGQLKLTVVAECTPPCGRQGVAGMTGMSSMQTYYTTCAITLSTSKAGRCWYRRFARDDGCHW
jgi:hypothetical protein